ncbi:hypothetical protein IAT38_002477 [Cryptococcus sp. DSM 104549]
MDTTSSDYGEGAPSSSRPTSPTTSSDNPKRTTLFAPIDLSHLPDPTLRTSARGPLLFPHVAIRDEMDSRAAWSQHLPPSRIAHAYFAYNASMNSAPAWCVEGVHKGHSDLVDPVLSKFLPLFEQVRDNPDPKHDGDRIMWKWGSISGRRATTELDPSWSSNIDGPQPNPDDELDYGRSRLALTRDRTLSLITHLRQGMNNRLEHELPISMCQAIARDVDQRYSSSDASAVERLTTNEVERWVEDSFVKHAKVAVDRYAAGCSREDVWDEAASYADVDGSRTGKPLEWKTWSSPTALLGETPTEGVLLIHPEERVMVPELELGFSYSWDVFRPYMEKATQGTLTDEHPETEEGG